MTRFYFKALPLLVAIMMGAALVTSETTSAESRVSEDESAGYIRYLGEKEPSLS